MDLWLTMGTLLADPRLDAAIQAAGPDFKPMNVQVIWPDEAAARFPGGSGEFLEAPTTAVRDAIDAFFRAKYPGFQVPISLFCAARVCQLYKIQPFPASLLAAYQSIDDQYRPRHSKEYLSALGMVLVDHNVRVVVSNMNLNVTLASRLFWTPSLNEEDALKDFADALTAPAANLDPLAGPAWDDGCREVYYFYGNFARVGA